MMPRGTTSRMRISMFIFFSICGVWANHGALRQGRTLGMESKKGKMATIEKTKKDKVDEQNDENEGCAGLKRPEYSAFGVIQSTNIFGTLESLIRLTGLDSLLDEDGPFTVFAPTNSAFNNMLKEEVLERLVTDEFRYHLTDLMLHHVIVQETCYDTFTNQQWLRMANLDRARVRIISPSQISLRASPDDYNWSETNQLSIVFPDNPASNGVVHGINRVFLTRWIFQDLYASIEYNNFFAFADFVSYLGLEEMLSDEGNLYTLLVPSNDALMNLPQDILSCIVTDAGVMEDVTRFHILQGIHPTSSLADGENLLKSSYNDEYVYLSVTSGSRVSVNDQAEIIKADILAYNGVIHEISEMIYFPGFNCDGGQPVQVPTASPPVALPGKGCDQLPTPTESPSVKTESQVTVLPEGCDHLPRPTEGVLELVQIDRRLKTLATILTSLLPEPLSFGGFVTLFAPTDSAFRSMDPTKPGIYEKLLQDGFAFHLKDLIEHHVIHDEMCIDDLYHQQIIDLFNGDQAKVIVSNQGVFLRPFPEDYQFSVTNQLAVVFDDQSASNGVIHLVNRVFLTDWIYKTTFGVLDEWNEYSTLTSLLISADLEDTLRDEDTNLTLFAPANEAFALIDLATLSCLWDDLIQLTSLLSYHVLPQVVHTGYIEDGVYNEVATVQGTALTIMAQSGVIMINDQATVIDSNMLAYNGVVHGIDRVLTLNSATCLTA